MQLRSVPELERWPTCPVSWKGRRPTFRGGNRMPAASAAALVLLLFDTTAALAALRHAVVWYSPAADDRVRRLAAQRYEVGVTGKGEASDPDKLFIKRLNPSFRWFVYNSGTDNHVPPRRGATEDPLIVALARKRGWNAEETYLHYYDDTRIVMRGDTLLIPGWGAGRARVAAEARVPVYLADLSRRLVGFASRRALQLHKEAFVSLAFDAPFDETNLYPDGIFVDNSSAQVYNYGKVLSGGRVAEAPGQARIGSVLFDNWYWTHYSTFLASLKDTLAISEGWAKDGKRKFLMINVANIWDDSYVSRDVADILMLEFQYNPIRNSGLDKVEESHRRDALAASAGIASFYLPSTVRSVPGKNASYPYAEMLLSNLAWYLVTRTESSLFFTGSGFPEVAGWDTLTWRGCMDVANEQLGEPFGEPFRLAEGTDAVGNRYRIVARKYSSGLAVVRNRGEWNEGIEPQTAVSVRLPGPMAPVSPDGRIGQVVETIYLRNGQGALLLGDPNVSP